MRRSKTTRHSETFGVRIRALDGFSVLGFRKSRARVHPDVYKDADDFSMAVVSKFDSTLSTLLASTFIGGNGNDWARRITTDSSGNVYLVGQTLSTDFPTSTNAFDKTLSLSIGDSTPIKDAFVTKLDNN